MKKTYKKSFEQIRDFIEKDKLESEPHELYYIHSSALNILNTAKTISEKENIPLEKVTTVDIMRYYYNFSDSIADSTTKAFDSYIQYQVNSNELRNRDKEKLKKESSLNLAHFLSTLKEFLVASGALKHARIHHNVKMSNIELQTSCNRRTN